MKTYVKELDKLPLILKIVLAIPGLDAIFYGLYRICKGNLILGVLWFLLGFTGIGTVIDIVSLVLYGKIKILV